MNVDVAEGGNDEDEDEEEDEEDDEEADADKEEEEEDSEDEEEEVAVAGRQGRGRWGALVDLAGSLEMDGDGNEEEEARRGDDDEEQDCGCCAQDGRKEVGMCSLGVSEWRSNRIRPPRPTRNLPRNGGQCALT